VFAKVVAEVSVTVDLTYWYICIQTLSCAAHNCDILVDDENVMYVLLSVFLSKTMIILLNSAHFGIY